MQKKLFLFLVAISISFSSFANPFEILGVKSGMTKDEVKKISNLKESYGMTQLDLKNKNSFFDIAYLNFSDDGILYNAQLYVYKKDYIYNLTVLNILKEKYPKVEIRNGGSSSLGEYFYFDLYDTEVIDKIVTEKTQKITTEKKF